MNQNDWIKAYQDKDALWMHDGNPKRPHALFTSGKHSNGFFNSRLVIPDDELLGRAALWLLKCFVAEEKSFRKINGFVGPQTGATRLSELMSESIADFGEGRRFSASPAKYEENGVKSMVFSEDELKLLPGAQILLCEDVLTTGGSVDLTVEAVESAGGIVLPFVLVLVNRSGLKEVNGKKIISLIEREMPIWTPEECLLCKQGSEAIRPKGENWALLNSDY